MEPSKYKEIKSQLDDYRYCIRTESEIQQGIKNKNEEIGLLQKKKTNSFFYYVFAILFLIFGITLLFR